MTHMLFDGVSKSERIECIITSFKILAGMICLGFMIAIAGNIYGSVIYGG